MTDITCTKIYVYTICDMFRQPIGAIVMESSQ